LHDARTVGNRYQRKLLTRAVPALDREKVAIIECCGLDAHQHLAGSGPRDGSVDQLESLDAVRPLQFEAFHPRVSSYRSSCQEVGPFLSKVALLVDRCQLVTIYCL